MYRSLSYLYLILKKNWCRCGEAQDDDMGNSGSDFDSDSRKMREKEGSYTACMHTVSRVAKLQFMLDSSYLSSRYLGSHRICHLSKTEKVTRESNSCSWSLCRVALDIAVLVEGRVEILKEEWKGTLHAWNPIRAAGCSIWKTWCVRRRGFPVTPTLSSSPFRHKLSFMPVSLHRWSKSEERWSSPWILWISIRVAG